jgi:hypothetical protein
VIDLQTTAVVAALLASWGALVLWAVKSMLDRQARHIDSRFDEMAVERRKEEARVGRLERELLELKAELPRDYVRREDAIRNETAFHAKLDAISAKIDAWRAERTA